MIGQSRMRSIDALLGRVRCWAFTLHRIAHENVFTIRSDTVPHVLADSLSVIRRARSAGIDRFEASVDTVFAAVLARLRTPAEGNLKTMPQLAATS